MPGEGKKGIKGKKKINGDIIFLKKVGNGLNKLLDRNARVRFNVFLNIFFYIKNRMSCQHKRTLKRY
jgi:hypothetical protein